MNLKKLFPVFLSAATLSLAAAEPASTTVKIYGFVGNDFFYNSRQNVEMVDGVIHLFPKPIQKNSSGVDANDVSQSEMLSINTRLGLDITGTPVWGAKTSAKIEADFAGFGTSYYVLRIRQAYMKLNWVKSELTVGQTWHPFFSSVMPTTLASNSGAPFQAFNRSPLVRYKYNLSPSLSASVAGIYEMQYASFGPSATTATNIYMKNANMPDLFAGLENKTSALTLGAGVDFKRIKPDANNYLSSVSATAYGMYTCNKFQIKAKGVWGQNLSDQLMLGGYGVSKYKSDSTTVSKYTNYNNLTGWVNLLYGTKVQVGLILGVSANMGTTDDLAVAKTKKLTSYGYGFYDIGSQQQVLDKLYKVAPQISYNLSNFRFGVEYDWTKANYGQLQLNGKGAHGYSVVNNRVVATFMYFF